MPVPVKAMKRTSRFFLISFFVAIWVPLLEMHFNFFRGLEYTENRDLAVAPDIRHFSLSKFPKEYENFFGDHIGFRTTLIRVNNILRVNLFGVSPIASVVFGKDSWMYYRSEALADGVTFNDAAGALPLSDAELKKLCGNVERNRRIFSENGIFYLVVIAPNKNTIYEECLPENLRRCRGRTRMDQFMDYMKTHSTVKILDLRAALSEAKKQFPTYYKTDSHWNRYGAYVGYREIMKEFIDAFGRGAPLSIRDGAVSVRTASPAGDLAQMLMMEDLMREDLSTAFDLDAGDDLLKLNKLCFRHDSFGDNLYPYLNRHFNKVAGVAPFVPFDYDRILREKPDAVLHVFAERYITMALHDDFYYEETQ